MAGHFLETGKTLRLHFHCRDTKSEKNKKERIRMCGMVIMERRILERTLYTDRQRRRVEVIHWLTGWFAITAVLEASLLREVCS